MFLKKVIKTWSYSSNYCSAFRSLLGQLQKLQTLVSKVPRPSSPTTQTGTCLMVSIYYRFYYHFLAESCYCSCFNSHLKYSTYTITFYLFKIRSVFLLTLKELTIFYLWMLIILGACPLLCCVCWYLVTTDLVGWL